MIFIFYILIDYYYIIENIWMWLVVVYMRGGFIFMVDIVWYIEVDFYQFEFFYGIMIVVQENRFVQFFNGMIRCVENLKLIINGLELILSFVICKVWSWF